MSIVRTVPILILIATFISSGAMAEGEKLAEKLSKGTITLSVSINGCEEDAEKYCSGLPLDSQKAFMCMIAYEDKLSTVCKLGIEEAAMSLQMSATALDYSVRACEADADKFCLDVQPGDGRIVGCLRKHEAKVSEDCVSILKETGLWDLGAE